MTERPATEQAASELDAVFYDGRSARRRTIRITLEAGELRVRGDGEERRFPLRAVEIAEPMGGAPRLLRFPDDSSAEVADHAAFARWLAAGGQGERLIVRLQRRWHWALGAFAGVLGILALAYFIGLPMLAEALAPRIPDSLVRSLSQQTLTLLDHQVLHPSALSAERRGAIAARIAEVLHHAPGKSPAYRLHFRSGGLGPNAFALPDGDVVILDDLVKIAANDDEIAAVAAHELGHVRYRHGLRQLIQSSVVSFIAASYFGDVSSFISGLGALLMQSRYSRGFERQADDEAAVTLRAAGLSPAILGNILARIEKTHQTAGEDREKGLWAALSSHPDTAERIRRLDGTR